ncbi:hypothetical protein BGZ58_005925, partial [Dissophora ornata]
MEVETPLVDMTLVRHVDVDMLGVYFSYIRAVHKGIMYEVFRQAAKTVPRIPTAESIKMQLVGTLHKKLLGTFSQDAATVLHFDGLPTAQKAKAREARRGRISKNVASMNDLAQEIQGIVSASDGVPIPKAQKRRLLRLNQQAKRVWSSSRIIDSATKDGLITGLKGLGWEVCRCQGEADVCIGRKADKHPGQVVAASADSDLLFHRLKTLLRKDTKSHVFTEYKMENVIQKLQVNEIQWIVA